MPAEQAVLARLDFEAMGTTCHLLATELSPERLERARAWLAEEERRLTRFDPESELSRFNAAAGSGWVPVSDQLEAMLREALAAYELSGGLVHAAVLPSMLAIGYTRTLALGPTTPRPDALRPPAPLPDLLEVSPGRAKLRAGAGIDLGGLAKGWLADRLSERLGESCLVNLGGDLRARGGGPGGAGWPVGFGGVTVHLRDQGAATSSLLHRRWGADLHHLIDPRTGAPARTDLATVSALAPDATRAEVAAKTALLLGSAEAPGFLARHTAGWWLA
jgi:FAD:protein FMN transferase